MDNKQTTIFNVLLSCLILIILSIYILTINNTPGRIPIAKVNNMMIYDKDINYYLSTLFGSDANISINSLPNDQLEEIIRQYMIDYNILKLAKSLHIDDEIILQEQITANNNKLIKEFFLDSVSSKLVTDVQINTKYEEIKESLTQGSGAKYEYRVKHILVNSRGKAVNIKNDLKNIFFENAAQLYSLDKASAKKGGDLGYFKEGTMVNEFEENIKMLQVGEVSKPFKTDFGWHIAKLENKKIIPAPSLAEVREEITSELKGVAVTDYIEDLDNRLNIKIVRETKQQ
ncbi:MAG: peptidylprolyl isomerase [Rickettsiales bacterium]|jgi:parvulin-like peptidyl-prolyl isomerase|nr:peptidylprolyl isomerase [Rickettsiales bacterium]